MEASRAESKCKCGVAKCPCGIHLIGSAKPSGGHLCQACLAANDCDAGRISEDLKDIIVARVVSEDEALDGCPQCSGGRECNHLCADCAEKEMRDEADHQRSHGPGSL